VKHGRGLAISGGRYLSAWLCRGRGFRWRPWIHWDSLSMGQWAFDVIWLSWQFQMQALVPRTGEQE